jgi:hypothetical protein
MQGKEKQSRGDRICFGNFEVDPFSSELYCKGKRIKLQEQPFRILAMLLERPGEMVSRDALRRLEAMLIAADKETLIWLTGQGDVVDPDACILAIGSGGPYALAAARALVKHTQLTARQVVEEALAQADENLKVNQDSYTNGLSLLSDLLEAHFQAGLLTIQKNVATSGKSETGAIVISLGYLFSLR